MSRFAPRLEGTHVLVTGGSKGIGKAIAKSYLAEGANVSYCARNCSGDEFNDFENAAHGARAVGTSVDISDSKALKAWVEKAAAEFGRIDVVVANAHPLNREPTPAAWQASFTADILGLLVLIDASTPYLAERKAGSIIVMSSMAGMELRLPEVGTPYTTLKRSQASLAKDYSRKLAPLGIRINCIMPAFIDSTGKLSGRAMTEQDKKKSALTKPERLRKMLDAIPLGHGGEVEDAAHLAVFLGSHLSKFITGVNIPLDGGMSIFL